MTGLVWDQADERAIEMALLHEKTKIRIKKNGTAGRPWQVYCSFCERENILHFTNHGVVAVNTQGIGNRTHHLAILAAEAHIQRHRSGAILKYYTC